jgi:hypothetical protein
MREIHIQSYFSIETDLAAELSQWKEFVSGAAYDVDLACKISGESVTVRYVEGINELAYVSLMSEGAGALFERTLGAVTYALSKHSDNLMISRWK